jgi:predicted amidohydrolase
LAELDVAAAEAAAGGVALVVTPELALQGYLLASDGPTLRAAAATAGVVAARVGAIARRHGVALVVGFAERVDALAAADAAREDSAPASVVCNAAVVVDAGGELALHVRKECLVSDELDAGLTPRSRVPCAGGGAAASRPMGGGLRGARLGLLICADAEAPDAAEAAASAGADLLVVIASTDVGGALHPWLAAAAHAARFRVPTLWCNSAPRALEALDAEVLRALSAARGRDLMLGGGGGSRVLSPDGRDVAAAAAFDDAAVVVATLGDELPKQLAWSGAALRRAIGQCRESTVRAEVR